MRWSFPCIPSVSPRLRECRRSRRSPRCSRYSGSEAKAHPFRGGMKPTTGKQSTFDRSTGYSTVPNHQLL
ncbi:hypothetical protein BRD03_01985 [Halobacteriales archaeon QS_9_68_17]|nr:MAG: hypothetical protein BRD03_01985 [Halobacteriales archaeon QS_9_68_17]